MAKAKSRPKPKKNLWVGGSFKNAVGMYAAKKVKRAAKSAGKSLRRGFKQAIWGK